MDIIINSLIFLITGLALFNLLIIFLFRSGVMYKSREKDGTLKKKMSINGLFVLITGLVVIIAFFLVYDYFTFRNRDFLTVLLGNFFLFLFFDLYDAFFIDLFVLCKWRPSFLKIREELSFESMKKHLKSQFTLGWIFKIPIILISTLVYYFLLR
ncbi:MAG: hypothetical protein JW969_01290 [Spirochaetales bacterium]|nr:hypothetical protein [Spirochaetales bacterium]